MRILETNKQNKEIILQFERITSLYSKYDFGKEVYSISDDKDNGILQSFNRKLESLYHKQVELLFKEIKIWTSIHAPNIEIKWDILSNEENLENFYSSLDLQRRFKEIMEAIYLLLEHEQVSHKNKIEGLRRIDGAELRVCAPGILTHLMEYISFLEANDEFVVAQNQVLKELTKKFVYDHKWDLIESLIDDDRAEDRREILTVMEPMPSISEIKESIFFENEIHYYNAFYNAIAEKFGFKPNQDEFIDPDIPMYFFDEFDLYIDENLARRLMDYIVETRIAFIRNEAVIEKLNNDEMNEKIENWFGDESSETIRNNIFDSEVSSGSYYKDTVLSRQIIYFYTLEALKRQQKINANIFFGQQYILIISDEDGREEAKEATLFFCKKTPLFLGFYTEKEGKVFINPIDYIQVVNLNFMMKLSKDSVFFKEVYGFLDISQKEKLISAILEASTEEYGEDCNKLYTLLKCVPLSERQNLFTFASVKHYASIRFESMHNIFDFIIEFPELETIFLSDKFFLSVVAKSKKMHGLEFLTLARRLHSAKPSNESNYQLIKSLVSFKKLFPDKLDVAELLFSSWIKDKVTNLKLPIQTLCDIVDIMPHEFRYGFVQGFILDCPEQLGSLDVISISNLMDSLKLSEDRFNFLTDQIMIEYLRNIELSAGDFDHLFKDYLSEKENERNRSKIRSFYFLFFNNNDLSKFDLEADSFVYYMRVLSASEDTEKIKFSILSKAKNKLNSLQWSPDDIINLIELYPPVYRRVLLQENFSKVNELYFDKDELISFIELIPIERRFEVLQLPQIKTIIDEDINDLDSEDKAACLDLLSVGTVIVILKLLPESDHQAAIEKIPLLSKILKNTLSIEQLLDIFQVTNAKTALEIFNLDSVRNQCREDRASLTKEQLDQLIHKLIHSRVSHKNIVEEYNKTPGFLTKEIHTSIVAAAHLKRSYADEFFIQPNPEKIKHRRMACDRERSLSVVLAPRSN